MLCQFTVKNFKSIRDEATFDMQAAAISEHEDRIIIDKDEKNIYRCQLFMVRMEEENPMFWRHCIPWWQSVTSSFATEDSEEKVLLQKKLIVEPFAFSQSKDGSTEFELFFRTTVSEYRYIYM